MVAFSTLLPSAGFIFTPWSDQLETPQRKRSTRPYGYVHPNTYPDELSARLSECYSYYFSTRKGPYAQDHM